jgi:desulfoferrodoxin (superoxide reductase-like protein)
VHFYGTVRKRERETKTISHPMNEKHRIQDIEIVTVTVGNSVSRTNTHLTISASINKSEARSLMGASVYKDVQVVGVRVYHKQIKLRVIVEITH